MVRDKHAHYQAPATHSLNVPNYRTDASALPLPGSLALSAFKFLFGYILAVPPPVGY